jgi:hypothetical protein
MTGAVRRFCSKIWSGFGTKARLTHGMQNNTKLRRYEDSRASPLAPSAPRNEWVDGTFRSDAEMIHLGLGSKRALDMGRLPQSRPGGMLEHLARLPTGAPFKSLPYAGWVMRRHLDG